jgi:hypothetical protein
VQNGREMHAAMKGLEIQIGEKLMPIITKITTWLAENLPKAIAFVKGVIDGLKPTFQAIGDKIAWLVEWWKAHWEQIRDTVEKVFGYIRGFIDTTVAVIEAIWREFGDNILSYLQTLGSSSRACSPPRSRSSRASSTSSVTCSPASGGSCGATCATSSRASGMRSRLCSPTRSTRS